MAEKIRFNKVSVALKNLKRKTFRTAVLIVSIAILVSLLLFAISFSMTVNHSIRRASDRLGADLIIVPEGARDFAEEFLLESKNKTFYMPKSMIERVKEVEGIESLTYQTYLESIGGICCDVSHTQVVAFHQETDFIVNAWLGKALGRHLRAGEAIAGAETYENLGLDLLEVEKTLFNNQFNVVGVLDKTGTGLDNALFMSEEDLNRIIESGNSPLKKDEISIIFAKLKPGYESYPVGLDVEGLIIEVDVVARREMGAELLSKLSDINKVFLLSTLMAVTLTVFLVWAIFSAIVNERSKEIGIMRAIGAKRSDVVKLFVLEVFLVGIVGSVIGMVTGTLLFIYLSTHFSLIQDLPATIGAIYQTGIALLCLVMGTAICVTGALVPINRVKKMEPLIAIKEE